MYYLRNITGEELIIKLQNGAQFDCANEETDFIVFLKSENVCIFSENNLLASENDSYNC